MTSFVANDPRVISGMRVQLAARRALMEAGAHSFGWKIGLGSTAAMAQLGTTGPLVGFLTDRSVVPDGGSVAIGAWAAPGLESELAVRVGEGMAIDAIAAAIELVDLGPHDDVEAVLAANIFQRHVVFGEPQPPSPMPGHSAVLRDGELIGETDDPFALPGEPVALVAHVAAYLDAVGASLRAGEWIITGMTMAPPFAVAPGQLLEHRLDPLGAVSVRLTA